MAKQRTRKLVKKVKKAKPQKRKKVLHVKKASPALSKKESKKKITARKIVKKRIVKKVIKKAKKKAVRRLIKAKKVSPRKIIKRKPLMAKKTTAKAVKPKKNNIVKPVLRSDASEFQAESLFKARIKVVGIGGGGGSIVSEIGKSLEKATFVVADTDMRALKKRPGIKYFLFGQDLTHGLGTGVDIDLAKKAAEQSRDKASELFKDQDIVIFIASLGGGLGSGATQVFAETARKFGGITLGIFTMPFRFEGGNKQRIAQNALKSLRQTLNVSMVIPNEKIFKIIDENTPITDAFSMVNKNLIESLESLINLIYSPGIINIDFADLKTILKGLGNSAFLNTVVASGKDRAEKICKEIMANPLLQSNSFDVEKILFNIAGADNLSMFEVEKISTYIATLHPKAKIIFGISKNQKLKNRIKTTILMTGGGTKERLVKIPEIKLETPVIADKKIDIPVEKAKVEIKKTEPKKNIEEDKKIRAKKVVRENRRSEKQVENNEDRVKLPEAVVLQPVAQVAMSTLPALEQRKIVLNQLIGETNKKTIRRSGLEIKKAEEREEKKRIAQEKEWEIPAFLRRVKKI